VGIDITIYRVDKKEIPSLSEGARIVRIKNPDRSLCEIGEFRKYFHAVAEVIGKTPELNTSQFEFVLFTPELWGRMRKALVDGKWGTLLIPYVDKFICDVDQFFAECDEDSQLLFYWD
jgi:hypothetical protein